MTRWKQEFRNHGRKLECDFECLPYGDIDTVECNITENGITMSIYYYCAGWVTITIDRTGKEIYK